MADTKTSALTSYTTPLAGDLIPIVDTANSTLKQISFQNLSKYRNVSVSTPGAAFAADTYLVGSSISIPTPVVGSQFHCIFDVTKTGAGTATPIITLRIGTAGTTADAAICTFTFNAQTAVIDTGTFEVWGVFRTVGSGTSAVVQGMSKLHHNLAVTGLGSVNPAGMQLLVVTSSGFNSTTASLIAGLSVNGGTSAAWTITTVVANFNL